MHNRAKVITIKQIIILIILIICKSNLQAQEKIITLSLGEAIDIAGQQSLDAFIYENMYLKSYWEYKFFKADRRPLLEFISTPVDYFNSVSQEYNFETNEDYYVRRNYLTSDVGIELSQSIGLTGGEVFMSSGLSMLQNIEDGNKSFSSTPAIIGYRQQLNGYNKMKWESKLEPVKFEKAKRAFIQYREALSQKTVNKFFSLVDAQIDVLITNNNYNNADTLYVIGQGRFQAGTITQDELLSLQLSKMNSQLALTKAQQSLIRANAELASFLGLDENTRITCTIPIDIPILQVNAPEAVDKAMENNPTILDQKQRMIEADMNVKSAKSQNGPSASIFLQYGLDNTADKIGEAYKDPSQSQRARIGFSMPILDWGRQRGSLEVAESKREETLNRIKQEVIDFRQNVIMNSMEFNIQSEQVYNAAKADTIANLGYEVTIQRFKIGKLDVTKLNIAQNDLSQAKRAYYTALRQYWDYYYRIRQLTLYDFELQTNIVEDFDKLVNP